MKVLAGDLGGTKTLLMIGACRGAQVTSLYEQRYDSAAFANLLPMVQTFLRAAGDHAQGVERACIAVAGPVTETPDGQSASITNLPWRFDSSSLATQLGIARVRLINDFQGVGYGIEALGEEDIVTLQMGAPRACGPRVVLGAGTGLGEGVLVWAHDFYEVLPSEGGHADFAPTDVEQIELLRALLTEFDHVSCERLICGHGLVRIYEFLRARHAAPESEALRAAMAQGDAAAAISAAALAKSDRLAQSALDLFARLYGAQAGNLALTVLATGGVYIAGGIAAKILDKLRDGAFMKAFLAKGRMAALLADMPVRVVINTRVGLLGAALAASRL
jgi:glucokinase